MDVALIPPKAMLEDMELTATRLFLPEWLAKDGDYHDAYLRASTQPWVTTILDNGAAEGKSMSKMHHVSLVNNLRPTEFALPDHLGDGLATVASSKGLTNNWAQFLSRNVNAGFVMQGTSEQEAWWSLTKILSYSKMKKVIKVVYIPRLLVKPWDKKIRLRLARRIHAEFPELEIHLFGMSSFWSYEPFDAARTGIIRSIDTSFPYQAALAEKGYDVVQPGLRRPDNYFNVKMSPKVKDLAKQNVHRLLELVY